MPVWTRMSLAALATMMPLGAVCEQVSSATPKSVLPNARDLVGFGKPVITGTEPQDAQLDAWRADGLRLEIRVLRLPDVSSAMKAAERQRQLNQMGKPQPGTATGQKLGDEAWHQEWSIASSGGALVMVRGGQWLINVTLVTTDSKKPKIRPEDLRLAEGLASGVVCRIRKRQE